MKNLLIAQRYSKALLRLIKNEQFDTFMRDIEILIRIFEETPEYIKILNSYLFPKNARIKLANEITTLLGNQQIWLNLFKLLIQKHRSSLILPILFDLEKKILVLNDQIKVKLTLAHEHDENTIEDIRTSLKLFFKRNIIFGTTIDTTIIGGFIAETDSIIIDGSIKHNLKRISEIAKL